VSTIEVTAEPELARLGDVGVRANLIDGKDGDPAGAEALPVTPFELP